MHEDFCINECQKQKSLFKKNKKLKKERQLNLEMIKCKRECTNAITNVCLGPEKITLIPKAKEAFFNFRINRRKCDYRGYVCSKLCNKDSCQNPYSPDCSKCKVDCLQGADSGCHLLNIQKTHISFERVYKDFS